MFTEEQRRNGDPQTESLRELLLGLDDARTSWQKENVPRWTFEGSHGAELRKGCGFRDGKRPAGYGGFQEGRLRKYSLYKAILHHGSQSVALGHHVAECFEHKRLPGDHENELH